jgi:Leu/Phe-tRNA-protein transferase
MSPAHSKGMFAVEANELLNLVADTPEKEVFAEVSEWIAHFYSRAYQEGHSEGEAHGRAYGYEVAP